MNFSMTMRSTLVLLTLLLIVVGVWVAFSIYPLETRLYFLNAKNAITVSIWDV